MHRTLYLLLIATLAGAPAEAQLLRKTFPGWSLSAQYAGSIGTASLSYLQHTRNERIAVGLSYGHIWPAQGGPLDAWALRFMYTPWQVHLDERWCLEPLQTGVFVAYTSGLDLRASWPTYLEKGYYWWLPNFRQHLFLRSQLSFSPVQHRVRRVAAYFEVNTNDLYVYSWWPNRRSIALYDILFFGTGVQLYFHTATQRPQPSGT